MNNVEIETLIWNRIAEWDHEVHGSEQFSRFAMENANFEIPESGLWYEVTIQHGMNYMSGMADKPMTRELGALVIQIFSPENTLTFEAKKMGDSLARHFQYYQKGKLTMLTASAHSVGLTEVGYQYNVRIPFRYN